MLDGPTVLGECYEGRLPRRERTAKVVSPDAAVLSIARETLHVLMAQQMTEFSFILQELAAFAGVPAEILERTKLAPFVRLQKYRLKETVKVRQRIVYLIVKGECRMSCKRREAVISRFNCLAISDYFQEAEEIDCTYTAYSTELHLIALSYDAIPLLPPAFTESLRFLHQARRLALQAPLPRLERQTNPSFHEQPPRFTHKVKKSSSMADL